MKIYVIRSFSTTLTGLIVNMNFHLQGLDTIQAKDVQIDYTNRSNVNYSAIIQFWQSI